MTDDPPLPALPTLFMREPRNLPGAHPRLGIDVSDESVTVRYRPERDYVRWLFIPAMMLSVLPGAYFTEESSRSTQILVAAASIAVAGVGARRYFGRVAASRVRSDLLEPFVLFDRASRHLKLPRARRDLRPEQAVSWQILVVSGPVSGTLAIEPHAQLMLVFRDDGGRLHRQLVAVSPSNIGYLALLAQQLSRATGIPLQPAVGARELLKIRGVRSASGWDDPLLSWPLDSPEADQFPDISLFKCAKCGYPQTGLPEGSPCPECGSASFVPRPE